MNGFLSVVSVFIAGKHCAKAAKRWCGMQSTIEKFFGTHLESRRGSQWFNLFQSKTSFVQTSARRKTVLECFSIVQLSASASKSFPVLQEL